MPSIGCDVIFDDTSLFTTQVLESDQHSLVQNWLAPFAGLKLAENIVLAELL